MCNSGMSGQGNSYAMPGFVPGGPNDPALGGSGYTNGGSFNGGNVQPGFIIGGQNDPALGGSGYQTYPNRPPMGNPIGYNPPVQNPGMPSFPNGPGNMRNNPILQPIVGNGGFQPPVQNPGMAMPGTEGPLLIGGSNPYPDNINIGYQPPVQNPGMPPMGGSFRPPVRNPGMPMPPSNVPENRIDGGARGEVYNPKAAFQNLAKGTMPSVKRFVEAGTMGRAKKAFEAGGGTWNKSVHKRLKNRYRKGN